MGLLQCVTAAADAEQFWQLLPTFRPDLVFLDVNMPDVKGDVVCRQLREREDCQNLVIVIFSSLSEADLEALAGRCGANAYLSKQQGLDALVEQVGKLVTDGII